MSGQQAPATENEVSKKAGRRGKYKHKASKSHDEAAADQVVVVAKDEEKPDKEGQKKQKKLYSKAREDRIMKALSEETPSWPAEQGREMSITGGYFLDQDPELSNRKNIFSSVFWNRR